MQIDVYVNVCVFVLSWRAHVSYQRVCLYVCVCMIIVCTRMCVRMYVYLYIHIYVNVFMYMYTYTYIYIYIHTYVYRFVNIRMYVVNIRMYVSLSIYDNISMRSCNVFTHVLTRRTPKS